MSINSQTSVARDTGFEKIPSPFITLDVAHVLNDVDPNPSLSINHLLDLRASSHPDLTIIGFPFPTKHGSRSSPSAFEEAEEVLYFTFRSLKLSSEHFANYLSLKLPTLRTKLNSNEQFNIGLLAQSGPDFLITVLACLRLGLTVLLLAPQLPISQICHLLSLTKSIHLILFNDSISINLNEIRKILPELSIISLSDGVTTSTMFDSLSSHVSEVPRWMSYEEESIIPAVIFHSSGTTGLPKPIDTLHKDLTQILPFRPNDRQSVFSFCTTPLYHGGLQDLFRALNSLSTICFFPLHSLPVTAENICRAVMACSRSSRSSFSNTHTSVTDKITLDRINVFLTVPYILRLMKVDPNGLLLLQDMKYVCFGGASLEEEVGDELCKQGIKLVSRYGSSESGFLLSSYRDFEYDNEWNWLREPLTPIGERTRKFKLLSDRTYELIIERGWPQMAVNADVYETGDLFESHPNMPRTWRYIGRADDIIVLSNGEKLNPNRVENILKSEYENIICSSLIFGSGHTHCGILILLYQNSTAEKLTKTNILKDLVDRVNQELPSFAQIWPEMILFLRYGIDSWPMSSKGLDQRKQILDLYHDQIEDLYDSPSFQSTAADKGSSEDHRNLTSEGLREFVRDTVAQVLTDSERGAELKDHTVVADENDDRDLFELGLDSLKALRIKTILQKGLKIEASLLPMNFVYEHATISRLIKYLITLAEQDKSTTAHPDTHRESNYAQMRALVTKFSCFRTFRQQLLDDKINEKSHSRQTILLTGATGSLGAHILNEILKETKDSIQNIVCLVRRTEGKHPRGRVQDSFEKRGIQTTILQANAERLRFFDFDLSDDLLGLSDEDLNFIMDSDTLMVIHAAWTVNFLEPLSRFERENLKGLQSLLNLFGQSASPKNSKKTDRQAKFVFCSSMSSVSRNNDVHHDAVDEIVTHDPMRAMEMGYAQSKWVAEGICEQFGKIGLKEFGIDRSMVEVTVMRIGQLSGDLTNGVWNATEYWPLLISSCRFTGCLPMLNWYPSWLPVDVCAEAIAKYVLRSPQNTRADVSSSDEESPQGDRSEAETGDVAVYHVFNPDTTVSWNEIVSMIQEEVKRHRLPSLSCLAEIRCVGSAEWLEKLSESESDAELNPSRKLLQVWKEQFSAPVELAIHEPSNKIGRRVQDERNQLGTMQQDSSHENSHIQSRRAQADLKILKKCGPISQEYISKMLRAMEWSKSR